VLDALQIAVILLLALCCAAGIGLQFAAWRHLKPGIPRYGHKDALFKKKEEYYTEAGMRYINMQKQLMYLMAVLFAILILSIEMGAEAPPP
jgi:hypothetical protein